MSNADVQVAVLAFIAFSIPIVGALWRLFSVRQMLEMKIDANFRLLETRAEANAHRLDLIEKNIEHLVDRYTLTFNGQREVLEHVRERSARTEEKLANRITDLERFLEKTTSFAPRNS